MCTLVAYVQTAPDWPLVVAANRDEYLYRPATEPAAIAVQPWVVAGQDLDAGGTWFGVNEHGLVAGLLNRRSAGGPVPGRRSRGLLCLEALQTRDPSAAAAMAQASPPDRYNGYNLLLANRFEALVVSNTGMQILVTPLPHGVHLLTNLDVNDPTCPRIARSSALFRDLALPPLAAAGEMVPRLRVVLADHATALDPRADSLDMLCVHLSGYGTRSSSIVAIGTEGPVRYWHAAGPPCQADFREVALPGVH